jgi:hypothetical protein
MRKAQMFIVTMIFLVSLIFAVQQNLSAYSFLDLSKTFEKDDIYIFNSIMNSFNESLAVDDCSEAENNLEELDSFIERMVITNMIVDVSYTLDCSKWSSTPPAEAPLQLSIHLKGIATETEGSFSLYKNQQRGGGRDGNGGPVPG